MDAENSKQEYNEYQETKENDAVFHRCVSTLRHKYGSKIVFLTSNVGLILYLRNPTFSEIILVFHFFFHQKISKSTMKK